MNIVKASENLKWETSFGQRGKFLKSLVGKVVPGTRLSGLLRHTQEGWSQGKFHWQIFHLEDQGVGWSSPRPVNLLCQGQGCRGLICKWSTEVFSCGMSCLVLWLAPKPSPFVVSGCGISSSVKEDCEFEEYRHCSMVTFGKVSVEVDFVVTHVATKVSPLFATEYLQRCYFSTNLAFQTIM